LALLVICKYRLLSSENCIEFKNKKDFVKTFLKEEM